MKVRQLKHYAQSGMAWNNWMAWMGQRAQGLTRAKLAAVPVVEPIPSKVLLERANAKKAASVPAAEHSVEAAKQEFVVVKKNGGEVVDTFDIKEDALALIEKHKKQKKAALMLLDKAEATA
jgi:hypothetical protein